MSTSSHEATSPFHQSQHFDATAHLAHVPPRSRMSMADLGLGPADAIGVTEPFPLASLEGVKALRASILTSESLQHAVFSPLTGPHVQLRGITPHAAPFVHQFWTSREVLKAVSDAAGEELVPVFPLEEGHVNIQVPAGMSRDDYMRSIPVDPCEAPSFAPPAVEGGKTPAVVGFHKDAYPWVAVLMLSDVSSMKGGETGIKLPDGSLHKARGPSLGSCVVMRGGSIEHIALPCEGARERITMVASFRPKRVLGFRDESNLRNILDGTNWNELYDQWLHCRLEIAQEKIEAYRHLLRERRERLEGRDGRIAGLRYPTVDLAEFAALKADLNDLLDRALNEMEPYDSPRNVWSPRSASL